MNKLTKMQNVIYGVLGVKVMLDRDLTVLYQVETKALNQAVKRNAKRFPEDFMFRLTASVKIQIGFRFEQDEDRSKK